MAQAIAYLYVDLRGWMCMLRSKCLDIQPARQARNAVTSVFR
jgi:hypothetical protein